VTKFLNHLKHNVIAYLALFVALGGTSYAAINLPAGSVGTRQLQNGAVTNKKLAKGSVGAGDLDPNSIAGYVRDYAEIHGGKIVKSRPRARLIVWNPSGVQPSGTVQWSKSIPTSCFALANTFSAPPSVANAQVGAGGNKAPGTVFLLLSNGQADVQVAVICPRG
jgi:hypothetical protein